MRATVNRNSEKHSHVWGRLLRGALSLCLIVLVSGFPSLAEGMQPGAQAESQTGAPLHVLVGKSLLVTSVERLKRVSVTDPAVADAMVVTPTQVLVHGRAPGDISLLLWDEQEHSKSYEVVVEMDVAELQQQMDRMFPEDHIKVIPSRNAVLLDGHVATKDDSDRAGAIAGAYTKNVVNVLTSGPVGAQEVLLEVKFASVDRTRITQWGFNLFSTGAANTFGATSTQQFAPFTGSSVGTLPTGVSVPGNNAAGGFIGSKLTGQQAAFGTSSLLNLFLFRSDLNLGAIVQDLQQNNILQMLAEPNLIAVNGKESSFLAGGEFPYPVVQNSNGNNAITIVFKEFGVRLKFTPLIMPSGNIHLKVAPEVSSLDFTNAVQISGFLLPALTTRKAESELELQDGQSFVIAGLLDNTLSDAVDKIPVLGDIPILGNFFKSKNKTNATTELMVMITAHKLNPESQPKGLPKFPEQFLTPNSAPVPGSLTGGATPAASAKPSQAPAAESAPAQSAKMNDQVVHVDFAPEQSEAKAPSADAPIATPMGDPHAMTSGADSAGQQQDSKDSAATPSEGAKPDQAAPSAAPEKKPITKPAPVTIGQLRAPAPSTDSAPDDSASAPVMAAAAMPVLAEPALLQPVFSQPAPPRPVEAASMETEASRDGAAEGLAASPEYSSSKPQELIAIHSYGGGADLVSAAMVEEPR